MNYPHSDKNRSVTGGYPRYFLFPGNHPEILAVRVDKPGGRSTGIRKDGTTFPNDCTTENDLVKTGWREVTEEEFVLII